MSKKWEPHKKEILRLYIIENLTLDQVMDHMLQTHGFKQKKSQYEYKLKVWGARKNVKKEVLEYLTHQDRKRGKLQSLNSGAYIVDGILLSEARVNRARQRHDLGLSLARKYGRAPSPQLPPGHIVRRASPGAPEVVINWPQSLPWLQFERRFSIVVPQSSRFIQILAQAVHDFGFIPGIEFNDSSDLARAIYAASYETSSTAANLARMLPSIPSDSQSSITCIGLSEPTNVATKILKAFLFQVSNKRIIGEGMLLLFRGIDKTYPMFLSQLTSSADPTSEAILESLYENAVKYGATALVSRLLDTGRDANALLGIQWSCRHSIERGKASLRMREDLYPMTALQSAASTCNIQLASILMDAGAKADLGSPTPMQILCLSPNANHPDALRFAHLLLGNGARVDAWSDGWISPLGGAVISRNISLVRFLLQCGATESLQQLRRRKYIYYQILETKEYKLLLPGKVDNREPTSPLQLAIILGDRSIAEILISSITKQEDKIKIFEQAFITACMAGGRGLVQILLHHLDDQLEDNQDLIDSAFFATAWDMNCHVSHLLLENEAVRNQLQISCLSIFQAAALYGNTNLIMLLKSSGFDINCGPSLEFGVRNPFRDRQVSPPSILSTPLGCAVWMGHEDAISILLDLGAGTTGIDLVSAIQTRYDELIAQVLDRCENVDKLCYVQGGLDGDEEGYGSCNWWRALDVAIRYRQGIRLVHMLIEFGAVIHGYEIVDAVRSDDHDVIDFFLPGCNILATSPIGENVLETSCRTGNLTMAQLYFSRGGAYGSRALFLAAGRAVEMHDYRVIEHLVANRPPGPIDKYEASALALSFRMGDTILIDMLLDDTFRSSTALSIYCGRMVLSHDSKVDIESYVQLNCYHHPDPNIGDGPVLRMPCSKYRHGCEGQFSPLLVAAAMRQEENVRMMLDRGYLPEPRLVDILYASSSYFGEDIRNGIMSAYVAQIPHVSNQHWHRSILLSALKCCADLGIVQQHLTEIASLNFEFGRQSPLSPLKAAVKTGIYDYVRTVLEAGATADSRKWPPAADAFDAAVRYGSLDIISLLLENGADINHHPHETSYSALNHGGLQTMVFLLDHGLDINAPASALDSRICLELAARDGTIDAVELLLSRGFDIQGRARIHYIRSVVQAIEGCQYATANLLKKRGGWNEEDEEIAKIPRARDPDHHCPRFVYDDLSLEGCYECGPDADISSSISSSSEGDASATSSPRGYESADEQFAAYEMDPLIDGLSIMDIDTDLMDYEQTTSMSEWPLVSYNQQDVELDMIVQGLLLEDGVIFDSI